MQSPRFVSSPDPKTRYNQTVMNLHSLGYAALCVLVPAAWGLAVYWLSRRIEARVFHDSPGPSAPDAAPNRLPLDFHI